MAAILLFDDDVILWVDVIFGLKEVIPFAALLHEVIVKFGFLLVLLFGNLPDPLPSCGVGRLLKSATAVLNATSSCFIA